MSSSSSGGGGRPAYSEYRLRSSIERGRQQYAVRNAAVATGLVGLCAAVYFYSLYAVKQEDYSDVPMPAAPSEAERRAFAQGRSDQSGRGRGGGRGGSGNDWRGRGRGARGRGRGAVGGRGRGAVGGGRVFGGGLTNEESGLTNEDGDHDDGGAAESSVAESSPLARDMARRLARGTYECMICCDKVRARQAIWQCDRCWAVFHIGCVKKWVASSASGGGGGGDEAGEQQQQQQQQQQAQAQEPQRWRCPGCQHARAAAPAHYLCFCGAVRDPEPARGQAPHSCGQTCGRSRGAHCPHACPLPCHPGPCPPCTALAPEQACFCGRVVHQPRCGAAFDPVAGARSCGAPCGELLSCGRHACAQPCHAGLCAPCPRADAQPCHCGRHTRDAPCGSAAPGARYSCGAPCDAPLACGAHRCQRPCHAHRAPADDACALDPAVAATCHCGRQPAPGRARCTDPVPSCGAACGRALPGCGHACAAPCHAGACPPCAAPVRERCGCGATLVAGACHAMRSAAARPRCDRVCTRKRACRRHQCMERCCPSDHVDVDGAVIPGARIAPGATDPHQCTLACDRLLRCKAHRCAEPCHRGACPPCRSVSFAELACACGRTRLLPPIACGAALPRCRHPCTRARACGHVSLSAHECHPDAEPCPPCPVLVAAPCMCGARELKNVPCHRSHASSCGAICGRLLPCGGHRCPRSCHRPDDPCLRAQQQACRQPCGKPRKACGHPCALPCHSPAMCDESAPCEALVDAACPCGRLAARELCGATAARPAPAAHRRLPCNDVCKIAERNRRLALALDLKDRADAPLAGLVRATYSDDLLRFARANLPWLRDIEARVAAFVADRSSKAALNFAPMRQPQRAFLHALAPFYGCRSRSVDHEPMRSVCWDRSPQSTIPSIALSAAVRYARAPAIVCSDRIHASSNNNANHDESDFDDSASHTLDGAAWGTNAAADRLRRRLRHIDIQDLRHALTADELRAEIDRLLPGAPYDIRWAAEDHVELRCTDHAARHEHLVKWEAMLRAKLPRLGVAGIVKGAAEPLRPPSSSAPSLPRLGQAATIPPGAASTIPGAASTPAAAASIPAAAASIPAAAASIPAAAAAAAAVADADPTDQSDSSLPDDWESLCT
ncbi:FKBP12-associated protein [Coemansia javaensis]|uniref:FKBP12-associated protein n=1 Tax=Coemansia javaensis TaxID=2761396 RepID=A0A9W8LHL5_9FUNG|nr:FKBP12-associated protein [Coemansia javaensis]